MGIYNLKYAFRVEIDGLVKASFKTAGPLEANVGIIEEMEGGSTESNKEAGRTTYSNIVLSRGITDNQEMWEWLKSAIVGEDYKKDLDIVQTDRSGEELKRWNVFGAFPVRGNMGDWDATAEESTMEEIELSIDKLDLA